MTDHPTLARIRDIALLLPEVEERPSHGQPTWFVANTQFAQFGDDHHRGDRSVVCVRTSGADEQAMLIETAPEVYSTPAYLGSAGWVAMKLGDDADWVLVEDRIARSWELAAPRQLLEAGGGSGLSFRLGLAVEMARGWCVSRLRSK